MDRPEKSSREASGAELWPIFKKNLTNNLRFRTIFPTQCLPCSPPPTGLPGLVSPAGYAQRSDLPDLQEPRNFRKRGEYPKQPAKNTKSRHPRKRPKSTPEVPPQAPAPTESARKVPGKAPGKIHGKCTWCAREKTRKCTPEAAGVYPEKSLESTLKVPGKVFQKCPESTRKRHPKYTKNPRPCNFQELSWVLSRRGTFPSPRRVLLVHYSQYFPGATGNWLRKHLRPGHPPTPLAGVRRL